MVTEQDLQKAGADVAPRVTMAAIELNIASEHYFTADQGVIGAEAHIAAGTFEPGELRPVREVMLPAPLKLLTFCVLVLKNGFTVTGESACASPENFNEQIGRMEARDNALQKIWPLMGYELRTKLAEQARGPLT